MPIKTPFSEDIVVTFIRIGQDRSVPDLELPAGPFDAVREGIHSFVAEQLGFDAFVIQLWSEGGFIDVGTHSAGAFVIRKAAGEATEAA